MKGHLARFVIYWAKKSGRRGEREREIESEALYRLCKERERRERADEAPVNDERVGINGWPRKTNI